MAWSEQVQRWWGYVLWRPRVDRAAPRRVAVVVLRVLAMTVEGFREKRLQLHASDLSFYVGLSLVPFLAFVMLVLKVVRLSSVVEPIVLDLISAGNKRVTENLTVFIANAQGTAVGGVGVVLLFIVGFMMLQRVKAALNNIWGVQRTPRYSYRLIEYIVVLTVAPLALGTIFSLTTFVNSIRLAETLLQSSVVAEIYPRVIAFSSLPLFVLILLYAYQFLPDTRVRWSAALVGALTSGVLIQMAQDVYIYAFFRLSTYNLIYGAFAVLPFLMIWFYLAWLLFLFGAQLSCTVQNYTVLLATRYRRDMPAISRPYVLVAVLLEVAREFQVTGKPARLGPLAKRLHIARGAAEEVLRQLAEAFLVTPVRDRRNSYVPAERMDRLGVGEVLERLGELPHFSEQPSIGEFAVIPALGALFAETNRALAAPLHTITVADLLARTSAPGEARPPASGGDGAPDGA